MFGDFLTYMFPGGRALKLVKNGINITNSTNPLQITKNITLTVLDCCAPPPIRLAAPNPVTVGSSIHLISEIYDNC